MRFFSLMLAVVFFAGCSWLSVFDGNIPQNNWKIQKIIVGGKEYLSPQLLKAQTLKDSQNQDSKDSQNAQNTQGSQNPQNSEDLQNSQDSQNSASANTDNLGEDGNVASAQNTLLSDGVSNSPKNASSGDLEDSSDEIDGISDDEADTQDKSTNADNEFTSLNEVSTMTFDPSQHRIYGIAACNNYFASYAWKDDDHIEVGNSGITRKLCSPDELMSFEFSFIRDLNGLFTITKNKTSMILDNGKMQIYLEAIKP